MTLPSNFPPAAKLSSRPKPVCHGIQSKAQAYPLSSRPKRRGPRQLRCWGGKRSGVERSAVEPLRPRHSIGATSVPFVIPRAGEESAVQPLAPQISPHHHKIVISTEAPGSPAASLLGWKAQRSGEICVQPNEPQHSIKSATALLNPLSNPPKKQRNQAYPSS
jgi:hypothetical protein